MSLQGFGETLRKPFPKAIGRIELIEARVITPLLGRKVPAA